MKKIELTIQDLEERIAPHIIADAASVANENAAGHAAQQEVNDNAAIANERSVIR